VSRIGDGRHDLKRIESRRDLREELEVDVIRNEANARCARELRQVGAGSIGERRGRDEKKQDRTDHAYEQRP
jgi:hypothetical protein